MLIRHPHQIKLLRLSFKPTIPDCREELNAMITYKKDPAIHQSLLIDVLLTMVTQVNQRWNALEGNLVVLYNQLTDLGTDCQDSEVCPAGLDSS